MFKIPKRIPVEVWGERLYPLVVHSGWAYPPQHYKNHNHPQSDSLQIPRLASIQKGYPSIQWVSKTTIKWSSKTGELFVAGQFCCRTRLFFPHIPGLKSYRNIKALQKQFPNLGKGSKVACLQKVGDPTCWTRNKQVVEKALVQEICPTFFVVESSWGIQKGHLPPVKTCLSVKALQPSRGSSWCKASLTSLQRAWRSATMHLAVGGLQGLSWWKWEVLSQATNKSTKAGSWRSRSAHLTRQNDDLTEHVYITPEIGISSTKIDSPTN